MLHLNGLGRVLFDGDSCLNREKAKGEKRKKTIIAEGGRDAEDAELRKRRWHRRRIRVVIAGSPLRLD